jgi:uncharacterized protein YqfB (UPF0267 family)
MTSPRIFFRDEMAKAVLGGRKTCTTRDHERKPGVYAAVVGDYDPAREFATIEVKSVKRTTWADVFQHHYAEEGFMSPQHMREWCTAEGLFKKQPVVFLHRFVVLTVTEART